MPEKNNVFFFLKCVLSLTESVTHGDITTLATSTDKYAEYDKEHNNNKHEKLPKVIASTSAPKNDGLDQSNVKIAESKDTTTIAAKPPSSTTTTTSRMGKTTTKTPVDTTTTTKKIVTTAAVHPGEPKPTQSTISHETYLGSTEESVKSYGLLSPRAQDRDHINGKGKLTFGL